MKMSKLRVLAQMAFYSPTKWSGASVLIPRRRLVDMRRDSQISRRENEAARLEALSSLPSEVREAYLDVIRTHRRLLARLAQR